MSIVGTEPVLGVPAATRLRALWLVLVALVTLATTLSVFTSSIDMQEGEFVHALRSGEISTLAVGHSQDFGSEIGFGPSWNDASDDIAVSWVNRFGLRREAVLSEMMVLGQQGANDSGAQPIPSPIPSGSQPGTEPDSEPGNTSIAALDPPASIAATARSLGAQAPTMVQPGDLPLDRFSWLAGAVPILMVVIMLFGAQPRRTTKWGAFWAYTAPLNIGIFWALLRDSPWNERMNRLPDPRPGDRVAVDAAGDVRAVRLGGWSTFAWATLAQLALSVLLLVVVWALPDAVDPIRWTVVNTPGTP
jgi:hypothetical protein